MQKNQACRYEQCRAASLIVLHARRAECFLLVSAGNVIQVRCFGFGGPKLTNVIQFIS
jgi:hypothetical protein